MNLWRWDMNRKKMKEGMRYWNKMEDIWREATSHMEGPSLQHVGGTFLRRWNERACPIWLVLYLHHPYNQNTEQYVVGPGFTCGPNLLFTWTIWSHQVHCCYIFPTSWYCYPTLMEKDRIHMIPLCLFSLVQILIVLDSCICIVLI